MSNVTTRAAALGLCLVWLGAGAQAFVIDDFGGGSANLVTCPPVPGPPCSFDFQYSTGVVLGGDREETITNNSASILVAGASGGSYSYANVNASGSALLVWDGAGGSFPGVDATGLGGVDFTQGGHNALLLRLLTNDSAADLTFTAYTSAANFSTATLTTPGGIPGGPALDLVIGHSSFVTAGGSGADFTNIGALTLEIDGTVVPLPNMSFDFIETVNVPEPDSAALVALGLLALATARRAKTKGQATR